MRKRRAIIYDDDKLYLDLLGDYFVSRGYEVLTYQTPVTCPIEESSVDCTNLPPCADIIIADIMMLTKNGSGLLEAQSRRGCKVPVKNKAIVMGYSDYDKLKYMHDSGYAIFKKPFSFGVISKWLDEREQLMDLSQPLGITRKEKRNQSIKEVTYKMPPSIAELKGTAVNMSPSGLCMKTNTPLKEEQHVTLYSGLAEPSRPASVRWVKKTENGFYMAGLHFTQ